MRIDLVERLYEKIMEEPIRPKVLIARSYAEGHQWLEQICKRKGSVYNVEVQTLSGFVIEKARLELFRRQVRLLDSRQSYWIVRHLMKQLAMGNAPRYITEDMLKPGIADRVHRAITEVRLAAVHPEDIGPDRLTNPDKGEYLRDLLSMYEMYLRDHRLTDDAGLVDYLRPDPDGTLYLAIEPTGWSKIERSMADKLACGRLYILEADEPFQDNEQFASNSFDMFRASGTAAEIREGFRRMLSEPVALDRTEIILSDYERYVPVVHARAELLGIECTLANGLPLAFCAAGRAAAGMLNWIEEGYPATKLTEMLRHGEILFQDDRWSQGDWIRLLEQSGIGWGKDRYVRMLQPDRLSEEDREPGASLLSQLEPWFADLPDGTEWDPIRLLAWLSTTVRNHTAARSPDDGFVQVALLELAVRHASSPSDLMPMDMAIRYVRDMLASIRIRVSATPKPGMLHVSSLQNGGWSGRDRTWIAGMDERAWGVSTSQDPVLLDEERAAISADLETMGERARLIRRERESRLALIRGEVWLSYVSYDTGEQKGQSPAFEMLQAWRLHSGDENKDFGELEHALGEPYGVMDIMHPAGQRQPIDASDEWTEWLVEDGGRRREGQAVLHRAYPALAAGYHAQTLRQEAALSAYDGWLDLDSDSSADPDALEAEGNRLFISASQLEHYARCGMQYYFSNVLKLRPKDAAAFDRSCWLQPVDKGNLLHLIFRLYMEHVTDHGTRPAAHDRTRLTEIMELAIREFELRIPAPSPHVFAKECEEIRRDVEIFYRKESANTDQPCFFELGLTLGDGEPMEIALPGGVRVRLKGFIDRIDRIGPHQYRIIDYKTGSASRYAPSEYFSGGTQLQHALYSAAAEQWFRQSGHDHEAEVVEADYVFPTERGRGDAVRRMQNRREELAAVVSRLLESRERGIYIPTKDEKQCAWCDYQSVCGRHAQWMKDKRNAEENAAILESLLEVEEFG